MQSNGIMQFTIGGKKVSLSKESVEAALRNVAPGPISRYRVNVGNTEYPIKQVLSLASGIPPAGFITTTAYRILSRLGFDVKA